MAHVIETILKPKRISSLLEVSLTIMVEGNNDNNKATTCKTNSVKTTPIAPVKKFHKKEEASESVAELIQPPIPPRPILAPKLPLRPGKLNPSKRERELKSKTLFPLEDNIFTGLKPETIINKFYSSENSLAEPINLPADFIPKVFVGDTESILGLQHGKIVQFHREKDFIGVSGSVDSSNRQFYELIPFIKHEFLAFQDTGTIFKVTLSTNFSDLSIKILLRDSIPMGSFCKILIRPELDEIWVIGLRETCILLMNSKERDVALIRRVTTHFPEAVSVSFLGAEELAVVRPDRSIQVFTVARHSHQPALIAKLPSAIGDLMKILKIPALNAFGTIYADGKMIIWRFEGDELVEKSTVPLTLFRIQSVHIATAGILWLGLGNGKLLLTQLKNSDGKISILAEAKYHQNAITKFIASSEAVVSFDSSGQLCTWDESLTFHKKSREWMW